MSRLRGLLAPLTALATTLVAAPALASTTAVTPPASTSAPEAFYWQLAVPQVVQPGTFLVALKQHHASDKGTRSDQQFFEISSTGSNDVPTAALTAYKNAAKTLATQDPACHLSWTMLAAIGRVESNHGRFGGAQLGSDGVSRPAIVGPQLDGSGAFAAIHDTDHGTLDGDKVWDRAVGQMQFLPETWRSVGRDGDGDGKADPQDINDSALAAGVYLCGSGGDLSTIPGKSAAAFRYNHSDYYVQLVLSFDAGYQTGVFAVPSPPPPPEKKAKAATKHTATATHSSGTHTSTTTSPSTSPSPKPKPSPSTSPTPTPSPSPSPVVDSWTGVLKADGQDYTLDGVALSFPGQYSDQAKNDLDGDGTTGTNRQELDGLVALGNPVTIHGSQLAGTITVDQVQRLAY